MAWWDVPKPNHSFACIKDKKLLRELGENNAKTRPSAQVTVYREGLCGHFFCVETEKRIVFTCKDASKLPALYSVAQAIADAFAQGKAAGEKSKEGQFRAFLGNIP